MAMRSSAPASVMADRQRSQSMYAAGRESEVEVDVSSFTRYADEPGPSAGLHLLTSGSVRAMYRDGERPKHPSVQLVDLVTLDDSKRVKCNISDGHESGAAVLTAALSARVLSGELAEGYEPGDQHRAAAGGEDGEGLALSALHAATGTSDAALRFSPRASDRARVLGELEHARWAHALRPATLFESVTEAVF